MEKIVSGVRFGFQDVWGDIAGWFFIGVVLAALISALVPDELMANFLGGGLKSMLIMLLVGIPLYICATASTPVAAALILKGVSPGAALVFLLVGPATNVTSLSVLIGVLGKKSTFMYLTILSVCAVGFGLGVDVVYHWAGISPKAVLGEASELVPEIIKLLAAVLLLGISLKPLYTAGRKKFMKKPRSNQFISPFPPLHDKSQSKQKEHCSCCK